MLRHHTVSIFNRTLAVPGIWREVSCSKSTSAPLNLFDCFCDQNTQPALLHIEGMPGNPPWQYIVFTICSLYQQMLPLPGSNKISLSPSTWNQTAKCNDWGFASIVYLGLFMLKRLLFWRHLFLAGKFNLDISSLLQVWMGVVCIELADWTWSKLVRPLLFVSVGSRFSTLYPPPGFKTDENHAPFHRYQFT